MRDPDLTPAIEAVSERLGELSNLANGEGGGNHPDLTPAIEAVQALRKASVAFNLARELSVDLRKRANEAETLALDAQKAMMDAKRAFMAARESVLEKLETALCASNPSSGSTSVGG